MLYRATVGADIPWTCAAFGDNRASFNFEGKQDIGLNVIVSYDSVNSTKHIVEARYKAVVTFPNLVVTVFAFHS